LRRKGFLLAYKLEFSCVRRRAGRGKRKGLAALEARTSPEKYKAMNNYTEAPSSATVSVRGPVPLEKLREQWQFQLIADQGLTGSDLRIALIISWHLNRETRDAFPGIARMAKLGGVHRATVIRATQRLETRGHLQITRPAQRGDRAANRYRPLLKGFDVTRNNVTRKCDYPSSKAMRLP
jgi:DNA-binding MarR family transcriptional regulator